MSDPLSTLATSVATKAGQEIASTASKGIGQTFADIWFVIFGAQWSEKRQKTEIEVALNVERFKEELMSKADQIPTENRIEPDIDTIATTLDAAKYRINKQEIRDMFSNLIVSAMDDSKVDGIHPSFSEMIKMLSPLDAQNLYYLYQNQDTTIVRIVLEKENGSYIEKAKHFYLGNPECQDIRLIEPSIDNLIRLKLVDVTYDEWRSNDSLYEQFFSHSLFSSIQKEFEELINGQNTLLTNLENRSLPIDITDTTGNIIRRISSENERLEYIEHTKQNKFNKTELKKGIIGLTALGKNFCKVCL